MANAVIYNPGLALAALAQQGPGAVAAFCAAWFGMIFASKPSGKPKHFRRMHDKKARGAAAAQAVGSHELHVHAGLAGVRPCCMPAVCRRGMGEGPAAFACVRACV